MSENDYTIQEVLARNASGQVKKALNKITNQTVLLKIINKQSKKNNAIFSSGISIVAKIKSS